MEQFYERMAELPLFQGISRHDFMTIAGRIRFNFLKKSDTVIVAQDTPCQSLFFVLRGNVCFEKVSDDYSYTFREWFSAPTVVQPEALFGLRTTYTYSALAGGKVQLAQIDKNDVHLLFENFPIFRINYLNMICSRQQQAKRLLWSKRPEALDARFVHFVRARSTYPAGHKQLQIGMAQLGEELGCSRLRISQMLAKLSDARLIDYRRQTVDIPRLEDFSKI